MNVGVSSIAGAVRLIRSERPGIVGIDGYHGPGKTRLSEAISSALGIPVIHLDDYLVRQQGTFINAVEYPKLRGAFEARPGYAFRPRELTVRAHLSNSSTAEATRRSK